MFVAARKTILLYGLFFLCLLPLAPLGQSQPAPAKFISSFNFTMLTGGIVIVRAALDNYPDSLNFILDTGSGGISLDSATCSYFNLKTQRSDRTIRGIAGIRNVDFAYNHTLHLPGISTERLDFHINDYDILTSVYGVKIDGIIGYSLFRRYILKIDYERTKIEVFTPGEMKYPRGGTLLKPQFTTLPMQKLLVKDGKTSNAKFYYDMGAGLCMLLSKSFAADSNILSSKRKLYDTQAEGLGGKASMKLTVIKQVKLGPYVFRQVPTYIFDDEYNATSYPAVGGLIGNDLLRRFNVILNYQKQQIFIKPNNRYKDSFDYSYSGLGIYLIEGKVTIVDVMKNSPAEKAGILPGDEIVAINTNFSGSIQAYKGLLQNANASVKMLLRRKDGALLTITFRIKSIR